MRDPIIQSPDPIVLLGAGEFSRENLEQALSFGGPLVAADGGAETALGAGFRPEKVIGDFDSLSAAARATLAAQLHPVQEQETTDFEKCLTRIDAPLALAVGFTGARVDHGLAVLNTIIRVPRPPTIVLGLCDITFRAPLRLELDLMAGTRLSLFPMAPVTGRSTGLRWPVDGIAFAPNGHVGTSNQALGGPVTLSFDGPGMLVILPLVALGQVVRILSG